MEKVKKRRGRPLTLDIAGDRRDIIKNIRFSSGEWEVVMRLMAESEIDEFSEYARLACLQVDPMVIDFESFALLFEIKRDMVAIRSKLSESDDGNGDCELKEIIKKYLYSIKKFISSYPFTIR